MGVLKRGYSDAHVRRAAAAALRKLEGPAVVHALGQALADNDERVRFERAYPFPGKHTEN